MATPKFKIGDRVTGTHREPSETFTITTVRPDDRYPEGGPFWYEGDKYGHGVWENYLEATS